MYKKNIEDVIKELDVDTNEGLSKEKVNERLQKYGYNKIKEKKKRTIFQKFMDQFKDIMILILLLAAAVSFGIAFYENDSEGYFESLIILLIVFINAIMGVVQESKAEKALQALQSLSAPNARVIRDGKDEIVDSSEVVPGDIIKLEAGDFIPADARILESFSLKSEESALTGESVPTEKTANIVINEEVPIGDRSNMVYSGCSITYGTAKAIITNTGMKTEMGKIANLLDNAEETQTPLQQKLAKLGKYLGHVSI